MHAEEPVRSKKWIITETRTITVFDDSSRELTKQDAMEAAFTADNPVCRRRVVSDHVTRAAEPVES